MDLWRFFICRCPFHEWSLSAYTDTGFRTSTVRVEGLYEPFLQNFISLLKGGNVDYTLAGPVEAVRVHLAARIALEKGKRGVAGQSARRHRF